VITVYLLVLYSQCILSSFNICILYLKWFAAFDSLQLLNHLVEFLIFLY
jgi:hypothetical protein